MNQRRTVQHSELNIKRLSKSLDLNNDRVIIIKTQVKSLSEELLGLFA